MEKAYNLHLENVGMRVRLRVYRCTQHHDAACTYLEAAEEGRHGNPTSHWSSRWNQHGNHHLGTLLSPSGKVLALSSLIWKSTSSTQPTLTLSTSSSNALATAMFVLAEVSTKRQPCRRENSEPSCHDTRRASPCEKQQQQQEQLQRLQEKK